MSYAEEQLYYACMNFCESFFHLLCEKEKMRHRWHPEREDIERIMEIENDRLSHAYKRLFKAIERWENDTKGCKDKYKLILEKIDDKECVGKDLINFPPYDNLR